MSHLWDNEYHDEADRSVSVQVVGEVRGNTCSTKFFFGGGGNCILENKPSANMSAANMYVASRALDVRSRCVNPFNVMAIKKK